MLVSKGMRSGQVCEADPDFGSTALLEAAPEKQPFDGDARRFHLGVRRYA